MIIVNFSALTNYKTQQKNNRHEANKIFGKEIRKENKNNFSQDPVNFKKPICPEKFPVNPINDIHGNIIFHSDNVELVDDTLGTQNKICRLQRFVVIILT